MAGQAATMGILRDLGELEGNSVIAQAKARFKRCGEYEAQARQRFLDDLKFANGDSDNNFQWPNSLRQTRDTKGKPCLTLNVVRQHNIQIMNAGRQSKLAPSIKPVSSGATKAGADAFKEIIRNIEYHSNADQAYKVAREFQIEAGWGYWRLLTDWAGEDSWDQEIFITQIDDPMTVYLDTQCKLQSGLDAGYGFVFSDVLIDEFEEAYPEYAGVPLQSLGALEGTESWVGKDFVRICEYFWKSQKDDKLASFLDPSSGERRTAKKSELGQELWEAVKEDPKTRIRDVKSEQVNWTLIVGDTEVDSTVWPGKYIPIVRLCGERRIIDGVMDCKGHTRNCKDAQRMYNYNASGQVEFVALQSKTPWVAPAKAIEGHEDQWAAANVRDSAVLIFNDKDENQQPLPPPQRPQPPQASPAFESGMTTAFNQLMMTSGQWQNQMGMMGNERTGEAISQRQQQGDVATFHFTDNFEDSLTATGVQLVDLIPKVYDSKRAYQMLAEDGSEYELLIDPALAQAVQKEQAVDGFGVRLVFNPNVGKYMVRADADAAVTTRREETIRNLTLIMTQAPQLTPLIGDLLMSAMNFKEASEAAERLRRMVPPQAMGQGPTQQEHQLTEQLQNSQGALLKALDELAKEKLKLSGKDQMRDIEAYRAQTDRMKALKDELAADPARAQELISGLLQQVAGVDLQQIVQANSDGVKEQSGQGAGQGPGVASGPSSSPPAPGAAQAPDGHWYLPDPTRPGKHVRVEKTNGQG